MRHSATKADNFSHRERHSSLTVNGPLEKMGMARHDGRTRVARLPSFPTKNLLGKMGSVAPFLTRA